MEKLIMLRGQETIDVSELANYTPDSMVQFTYGGEDPVKFVFLKKKQQEEGVKDG